MLVPLSTSHAAAMLAAIDDSCFAFHPDKPAAPTLPEVINYISRVSADPARVVFAALLRPQQATSELFPHDPPPLRLVGITSYLDIAPAHRNLEIGGTWITQPHRGGTVNPDIKLTMLAHAFDTWGALRVQLKCDARNIQSQRAITKLGAIREGVLRKHRVMPDGFVRDTVVFSIIAEEWPAVRERLLHRLQ